MSLAIFCTLAIRFPRALFRFFAFPFGARHASLCIVLRGSVPCAGVRVLLLLIIHRSTLCRLRLSFLTGALLIGLINFFVVVTRRLLSQPCIHDRNNEERPDRGK
jgi:hypothetical protein